MSLTISAHALVGVPRARLPRPFMAHQRRASVVAFSRRRSIRIQTVLEDTDDHAHELAIRQFKNDSIVLGIAQEAQYRRFFENTIEKRKRKSKQKHLRRKLLSRMGLDTEGMPTLREVEEGAVATYGDLFNGTIEEESQEDEFDDGFLDYFAETEEDDRAERPLIKMRTDRDDGYEEDNSDEEYDDDSDEEWEDDDEGEFEMDDDDEEWDSDEEGEYDEEEEDDDDEEEEAVSDEEEDGPQEEAADSDDDDLLSEDDDNDDDDDDDDFEDPTHAYFRTIARSKPKPQIPFRKMLRTAKRQEEEEEEAAEDDERGPSSMAKKGTSNTKWSRGRRARDPLDPFAVETGDFLEELEAPDKSGRQAKRSQRNRRR